MAFNKNFLLSISNTTLALIIFAGFLAVILLIRHDEKKLQTEREVLQKVCQEQGGVYIHSDTAKWCFRSDVVIPLKKE